jgi:diaminopimelate epimerase
MIMKVHFYKYHGAGNDFIILDNRNLTFETDNFALIARMCDRRFGIGADGLMLLQNHPLFDFEMLYYNSDGREGSMCGNGGRCIVSFARRLNIIASSSKFMAVDGIHEATIEENDIINLKMSDVTRVETIGNDFFLNTGSPHYVRFVNYLSGLDVVAEGRKIRYNEQFMQEGTNVNFVRMEHDRLTVYTYERGVEDETLACGTGITASALCAAVKSGVMQGSFPVSAKGGELEVFFEKKDEGFTDIRLKGPAQFVFEGDYSCI